MSQAMTRANQMSSGYKKYLLAFYYIASAKISLTIAGFGLLLVGLGAATDPLGPESYNFGVHPINAFSGIIAVVGISFFVFGILIYLVLLANRKVGEWAN